MPQISGFGWKRVVTRTVIVLCQILIGITIPSFGKILNLIGGSLITICTFILPPLMYMKLVDDRSDPKWPVRLVHGLNTIGGNECEPSNLTLISHNISFLRTRALLTNLLL